jgi:hypothetical protein
MPLDGAKRGVLTDVGPRANAALRRAPVSRGGRAAKRAEEHQQLNRRDRPPERMSPEDSPGGVSAPCDTRSAAPIVPSSPPESVRRSSPGTGCGSPPGRSRMLHRSPLTNVSASRRRSGGLQPQGPRYGHVEFHPLSHSRRAASRRTKVSAALTASPMLRRSIAADEGDPRRVGSRCRT